MMPKVQISNQILTVQDYLNYDDGTDTCYELVNGTLVEMPPESNLNARIATFIFTQFLKFLLFFVYVIKMQNYKLPVLKLASEYQI